MLGSPLKCFYSTRLGPTIIETGMFYGIRFICLIEENDTRVVSKTNKTHGRLVRRFPMESSGIRREAQRHSLLEETVLVCREHRGGLGGEGSGDTVGSAGQARL